MADGKVTIKAIFDGKQAEGEVGKLKSVLNGLGNTGNKIGSVFKNVLGANLVSSAITTTIGSKSTFFSFRLAFLRFRFTHWVSS